MQDSEFRIEYKYYVPLMVRPYLLDDLQKFTFLDSHIQKKEGCYYIASVYFENYEFKNYFEKIEGDPRRQKLRLRFYKPLEKNQWVNIELKHKIFDRCFKEKIKIEDSIFKNLYSSSFAEMDYNSSDPILKKFIITVKKDNLYPFIRIDYKRKAFFASCDSKVRITFDFEVKCAPFLREIKQEPYIPVLTEDMGILEIKTPCYFPFWLSEIIKKYNLKRTAVSKYLLSVQNLMVNSFFDNF